MLIEVDAQLLGPGEDLLAVDAAGERFVLELLFDGLDVDVGDGLAWPHQGDCSHETDQFIDGVENLLHWRRPRRIRVVGVGEDAVPDLLRPAALLKDSGALNSVLPDLGEALVVVVVEETDDARSEERRGGKECRSRWWPYH